MTVRELWEDMKIEAHLCLAMLFLYLAARCAPTNRSGDDLLQTIDAWCDREEVRLRARRRARAL
jgi:hypothetical protein